MCRVVAVGNYRQGEGKPHRDWQRNPNPGRESCRWGRQVVGARGNGGR